MKTDLYTKGMLFIIAFMLIVAALKPLVNPNTIVSAQAVLKRPLDQNNVSAVAKQVWEYKTIFRRRAWNVDTNSEGFGQPQSWGWWAEDDTELRLPVDMAAKCAQLGAQGWELVTVCPRAEIPGVAVNGKTGNGLSGAVLQGFALNGVMSGDLWVFKRPKS